MALEVKKIIFEKLELVDWLYLNWNVFYKLRKMSLYEYGASSVFKMTDVVDRIWQNDW